MSPRAKSQLRVTVTQTVTSGVSDARLKSWARAAGARLGLKITEVSVAMVTPATSRRLNRTYRRKDRPTNVLSFLYSPADGELVLCPAVIRREASDFGRTPALHTRRLLEHGLIHLMGYDHATSAQQRHWRTLEKRLGYDAD